MSFSLWRAHLEWPIFSPKKCFYGCFSLWQYVMTIMAMMIFLSIFIIKSKNQRSKFEVIIIKPYLDKSGWDHRYLHATAIFNVSDMNMTSSRIQISSFLNKKCHQKVKNIIIQTNLTCVCAVCVHIKFYPLLMPIFLRNLFPE